MLLNDKIKNQNVKTDAFILNYFNPAKKMHLHFPSVIYK